MALPVRRVATSLAVMSALCFPARNARAHGPGPDVQVNPPSAAIQNETTVVSLQQCLAAGAADTADIVLVAYNDTSRPGIGLDRSPAGGQAGTFQSRAANLPAGLVADPVLAVGSHPTPFPNPFPCGNPGGGPPPPRPAFLAFIFDTTGNQFFHAGFSRSQDGGQTWGPVTDVSPGLGNAQDKPWIAVDLDTNTPYVCWTDGNFRSPEKAIRLTGGAYGNFRVSLDKRGADNCQIQIDTAEDRLYLVWYEEPGPGNKPAVVSRRCRIPGPACDPPVTVSGEVVPIGSSPKVTTSGRPPPPNPCGGTRRSIRGVPGGLGIETSVSPTFHIDAFDSKRNRVLLVAWNDGRRGAADIFVKRSTNRGETWERTARQVNDVADGDQFMPGLTAIPPTSPGFAKLQWYDRREDPGNTGMRLWSATSSDAGVSWMNGPISDVLFQPVPAGVLDPRTSRPCYMGDYNGIFVDILKDPLDPDRTLAHFLHAWGDNRAGNPDVFFDPQEDPEPPPGVVPLDETPSFSIAAGGPSALPTVGATIHPAAVLRRQPGGPPLVGISCPALGLTPDGCDDGADGDLDDLAGLSYGEDFGDTPQALAAFSVAPGSRGRADTGVADEVLCSPAQAQADEFAAPLGGVNLRAFDGDGSACLFEAAPGLGLVETNPSPPVSDDLDALHGRDPSVVAPAGVPLAPVYFTLKPGSPSLSALGFTPAHILRTVGGAAPTGFATPAALGLTSGDRISDICLREDGDGAFDESDLLFFTLAPGSPTLASVGASAADVLSPRIAAGVADAPMVVLGHEELGLEGTDVVDALKCDFPWVTDMSAAASAASGLAGTVGGPAVSTEVSLLLGNQGPARTSGDVWLWVDAPEGVTPGWILETDDECAAALAPPGSNSQTSCGDFPAVGVHFQQGLPVGTTAATRELTLGCSAAGVFDVGIRAGIRGLEPPGAQDATPGNDAVTLGIRLECAATAGFCGDVNGDEAVNIGDALLVAQFDVGLRACGVAPFRRPAQCDINPQPTPERPDLVPDGECNIGDALKMAQCDVGLVACDFVCEPFTCPGVLPVGAGRRAAQ